MPKRSCLDSKKNTSVDTILGNSKLLRRVGEGAFNRVNEYVIANPACKELGKRFIHRFNTRPPLKQEDLGRNFSEIIFTKKLRDAGVSPEIYSLEAFESGSVEYIMEKMDGDLREYLAKNGLKKQAQIEKKLISLFGKMARKDIFCIDLKPENTVYKITKNRLDIKLIDFDGVTCNKVTDLYTDRGIQIKQIIKDRFKLKQAQINKIVKDAMLFIYSVNTGSKPPLLRDYVNKFSHAEMTRIKYILQTTYNLYKIPVDPLFHMNHYLGRSYDGTLNLDQIVKMHKRPGGIPYKVSQSW